MTVISGTGAKEKIIVKSLLERYEALAATDNYIFGFVSSGNVYACRVEKANELLPFIVSLGSASRGMGYSLRYNPNNSQKMMILEKSKETKVLCSFQFMEDNKHLYGNRGHFFETLCAREFRGIQNKNPNEKFSKCGDIQIFGKEYQVKFGCTKGAATFTNKAALNHLENPKPPRTKKKTMYEIIAEL